MSAYFDSFLTTKELQKNNIILKKTKESVDLRGCLEEKTLIDVDEANQIIMSRYLFGFLIPFQ